ncbi:DUF1127 domain-containing protein [Bauldia litoralis]|uniref:YjiS-like domain-containing protein n=1 Tax=Bauldia litoralis TaxID=665467 RepID=A0A1G6EPM3_9HYPH|nr:DUF1127 domain-containing protein [Bauldia litoralis]SDB59276.1 protein of unknown function [Bauldia litoralis]
MSNYLHARLHDPLTPRGVGFFRRWVMAIAKRRRMITALENLDDRTLADIGIYRGEIPSIVDGFDSRELRMTPVAPPPIAEEPDYERASNVGSNRVRLVTLRLTDA